MSSNTSSIVIDTDKEKEASFIDMKAYGSVIVLVILIIIVVGVSYYKTDSFTSPDGVVARKSNKQVRSDTEVDRTWNLKQLEKSVSLINKRASE